MILRRATLAVLCALMILPAFVCGMGVCSMGASPAGAAVADQSVPGGMPASMPCHQGRENMKAAAAGASGPDMPMLLIDCMGADLAGASALPGLSAPDFQDIALVFTLPRTASAMAPVKGGQALRPRAPPGPEHAALSSGRAILIQSTHRLRI